MFGPYTLCRTFDIIASSVVREETTIRRYHNGAGNVFKKHGSFYVRWWAFDDGERRQKSAWLCRKDREHSSRNAKSVRDLARKHLATVATTTTVRRGDVQVRDFFTSEYLPWMEQIVPLTGRPRYKSSSIKSA